MTLSLYHDINCNTGTFYCAFSDVNYIYAANNNDEFRIYNWSGQQVNPTLAVANLPYAICLLAPASAIVNYSGGIMYVDVATNQKTNVTTNYLNVFNYPAGQLMAGDIVNKIAIATSGTNGKVLKVNSNFTLTQLSPTGITSAQAASIIFRPDTSTFIMGTNNGKIVEIDSSGNTLKSISLPTDTYITAPTIVVTGLTYYGDVLSCVTGHGSIYTYQYSTGTLISRNQTTNRGSSSPTTPCFSDSASGTFLISHGGGQPSNATTGLTECFAASGHLIFLPTMNESVNPFIQAQIEPINSRAWGITGNSGASFGVELRLYNITSVQKTSEASRSQNPLGTDVSTRVIRIRDEGIGRSIVEVDQTLPSGSQPLICTDNRNYIEISLIPGSPEQWDIREFTA
jgi:hypothetical protein